jgi:hypothetical protein
VKELRWSVEKNGQLLTERNVSFEQLVGARFIGIEKHPLKPHQKLMLFEFRRYVWVIPYVEAETFYFLKTAFPSRKHTKQYLKGVPR